MAGRPLRRARMDRKKNPSFRDYASAAASKAASATRSGAEAVARKARDMAAEAERRAAKLEESRKSASVSPHRALEVLAKEHGYDLVKANPRSKSLAALSRMRAAPKGKSTRMIGIEALGIRLANERRDIDPSQYSFERRGFVGGANDIHPRMKDIALFERTYPDHTHDELQAFARAHEKIMHARVQEAMEDAHGKGWYERAHRNPKKNGTCSCGCGGKCGKKKAHS